MRVHSTQFRHGEHRRFHRYQWLSGPEATAEALLGERAAKHYARRQPNHRHASRLAEKRHGARRTWVDFKHVDASGVNNELDVNQPAGAETQRDPGRVVNDRIDFRWKEIECWIDRERVARVNASALDMFHDARNKYTLAIADGINFHFPTHEIFVDEHRVIRGELSGVADIAPKLLLSVDHLHRPTAKDIRGADKHRVANPARY